MTKPLKIAITGGSDGLGLELAKYLSQKHKAQIATCGTRKEVDIHADDFPKIFYESIDLRQENGPKQFLNFVKNTLGSVDIFINNAVSFQEENLLINSREFIKEQFLVNTIVPLELTQGLYQALSKDSKDNISIVMINTEAAIQPKSINPTYSASKSALLSYTKSLAITLKNSPLSICSLILGPLATPYYVDLYNTEAKKRSKSMEEYIQEGLNKTFPSHSYSNLVSMEEVAKTILFLHELGSTKNGCAWRLDAGVIPVAA